MHFQPGEDIEFVLKSIVALTYRWNPKVVIFSLYTGSLLIEPDDNKYIQDRHHDI